MSENNYWELIKLLVDKIGGNNLSTIGRRLRSAFSLEGHLRENEILSGLSEEQYLEIERYMEYTRMRGAAVTLGFVLEATGLLTKLDYEIEWNFQDKYMEVYKNIIPKERGKNNYGKDGTY